MEKTNCPNMTRCPLYSLFQSEDSLAFWKTMYCNTPKKHETCARYQKSQNGEKVEITLLPSGKHLDQRFVKK